MCKVVHMVRHAQGVHNVTEEKDHDSLKSPSFFDAPLSLVGWQQADKLREYVHTSGLHERIELVITFPLLRATQTETVVFGGESPGSVNVSTHGGNAANCGRCEVSSQGCPPFMAVELCRERLGLHPCDKRRSTSEYRSLFPAIDFSLIESDDDTWWKADRREDGERIAVRGRQFMSWLWTREEKEVVVVNHHRFLWYTLEEFVGNSDPSLKRKLCKSFGNCELRSFVMVDTGSSYTLQDFKNPTLRI